MVMRCWSVVVAMPVPDTITEKVVSRVSVPVVMLCVVAPVFHRKLGFAGAKLTVSVVVPLPQRVSAVLVIVGRAHERTKMLLDTVSLHDWLLFATTDTLYAPTTLGVIDVVLVVAEFDHR